ncbi:uncharacterized protein SAMN04488077_113109 [Roseovarius tolerans]|uniref:YecA family protein n=1 Tax=Roseovarius tolerans TaxID=74031 RepID=A0A1H8EQL4_9RHOB|nr:UPF0149 family protein [Roseovarius tolerans]SEN21690.1 uncharacterized protein SAMN04488077_113109 [Roseovarius tolerans]
MLTDDELDQLDALLLSLPNDDGMLLSELDGFCAGLIVCPEMIMPGEWLPCVWGNSAAQFETAEDVQRLTDLIMRHYNDVAQSLTPPEMEYGPLYDEDKRTGEILWESWCSGFERAMRLRPDTWIHIVGSGDEEAAASVNMMLALYNIAEGKSDLPKSSVKSLTEEAPELIPTLVLNLNTWTKSGVASEPFPARAAAKQPHAPFQGTKVGRNAPCPCGSGRKYKRCCGSN